MSDNVHTGSRRNRITKPNTKTPRMRQITCKVRACKRVKNLNVDGYCETHRRRPVQTGDLYDKCQECSEVVLVDQYGVTCDKCEIWHHIECVGITNDQYKCLFSETNIFQWYCRFCKPKCLEAVAKIELLESQTRNLASNVVKLTERVSKLENNITKEVKSNVRTQIDETVDIERRKMNLVVHNIPESLPDNNNGWYNAEKKAADTKAFIGIIDESLDMDGNDVQSEVKDVIRLGKVKESGKPRLLRVTLGNIRLKREILGKAKLLKSGKNKNIYINPDLTPVQRKKDYELRKELKQRKDCGERNIRISKGEIVNMDRHIRLGAPKGMYSDISDTDGISEHEFDLPDLAPAESSTDSDDLESESGADTLNGDDNQDSAVIESEPVIMEKECISTTNQQVDKLASDSVEMDVNVSAIEDNTNAHIINEPCHVSAPGADKEIIIAQINKETNQIVGDMISNVNDVIEEESPSAVNENSDAHNIEENNQDGGIAENQQPRQRTRQQKKNKKSSDL